jgi:hypothetical protein
MSGNPVPSPDVLRWLADWLVARSDTMTVDKAFMLRRLSRELREMADEPPAKTK